MRMDFELGVFVAYRWEWVDLAEVRDNDDEVDDVDDDDHDHNTDNEQGSDDGGEDGNSEVDGVRLPYITHKVIFKCIGSNREESYQLALWKSKQLLKSGQHVPVELRPEPTNPKDSQAIAFVCLIDGKWEKIGYVVREALSDVHAAIKKRKVLSVKYDWIKFITDWSRSGPGWFAGIAITRDGDWSREVMRCCSTR